MAREYNNTAGILIRRVIRPRSTLIVLAALQTRPGREGLLGSRYASLGRRSHQHVERVRARFKTGNPPREEDRHGFTSSTVMAAQ